MHYVEPPYQVEIIAFYFLKGKGSDVKKYSDLKALTIAVGTGSKYFALFDSDATLDKYLVSSTKQRYKMLLAGRIDTFIGDANRYDARLNHSVFKDEFEKAPYRVHAGNDYFAISKKSPYAKDRFKFGEVLKQLIDSGTVKDIFNKYGAEWNPPTQQAPK